MARRIDISPLVAERDLLAARAIGWRRDAQDHAARGWHHIAAKDLERAAQAQERASTLSVALRTIAMRGQPGRAPVPLFWERA